jgi:hypothetical protein
MVLFGGNGGGDIMISITLTATPEVVALAIDALCWRGGCGDGEDRAEFAKGMLLKMLGDCMRDHAAAKARPVIQAAEEKIATAIAAGMAVAAGAVSVEIVGLPQPEPIVPAVEEPIE